MRIPTAGSVWAVFTSSKKFLIIGWTLIERSIEHVLPPVDVFSGSGAGWCLSGCAPVCRQGGFLVTLITNAGNRALRVISVKSTSAKADRFLDLTGN